jgi:glycosyltransferase involved in cell wall biosynthesis
MKILHLLYESKGDYFGIGGVGMRAYEIYRHLKDHHEVTLLCKKYPAAVNGELEGLRHIFVGQESKSLTKTLLAYAYYAARYVARYGSEYDVVIEEFSPAIPTFLHAFTEKPIILQVQGFTGRLYFRKYNPFYAMALYGMESLRPHFYDNLIFVSPQTLRKFSWLGGKRITIISNGVSSELLAAPPRKGNYILYLGRLDVYGKGLDILLDAYGEFNKSFPDIELVVAGDGREGDLFKAEIIRLPAQVREKIKLQNWVSGEQKRNVIMDALFVVFPSRHEAQPIAVLEAMSSAKAVVVSDIPEFNFVTQCGAGVSFRKGDAMSLARSMTDLTVSDRREMMEKRGRDYVQGFTWDAIAKQYESFINDVIAQDK